ncbi:MAG: chain-length determining protein [Prevotella sp.]|nr:chain-length determining protein [Prevotella sp.]
MEENKNMIEQEEEQSIDFGKLFQDLLKHKKLYFIVLPVAFVLAAVYSLSLPNYYNCQVMLAPEMGGKGASGGSLAGLASSFGFNLGGVSSGGDAISPMLYPDLMNSVDFKTSLFPVKVTREGNKEKGEPSRTFTYYDYLAKEQKTTWWGSAMKAFFGLFSTKEEKPEEKVDPFRLTRDQDAIVKAIDRNVVCDVDKKTNVITINVTDQDPLICATMADSVKTRLQNFITEYRTSKVRVDLAYNEKLYAETKARYDKARQRYADFADSNQDVILESVRQRQAELENEMQLQYNAYQQVAAQLMAARAKVQEETPAFTTLQSATVPVLKAGPKRAQMCLIFVFLAFLGTTAWILYKEDDLKPLLGLS